MSEKEKDPEAIKQKISNKPIDYVKLNEIYEDLGKRFVPQQELSADEAFEDELNLHRVRVVQDIHEADQSWRNNASEQERVVKCYNCQGEGQMARQCTQPKRPRNVAWYKDKAMLAEAHEAGQVLDEEQLVFLADLGVPGGQVVQTIIPNNAAFQTEDLDTYDSNCDDVLNAKSVLMANISNYGSNVILEIKDDRTVIGAKNMLVEVGKFIFPMDFIILEMEEDSKVSLILGTILEEKLFVESNEFMAMIADENYESESDTEEPPFEKITFNIDYKIKTSLEEPPSDLELKPFYDNLEYVFLEEPSFLLVIISSQLFEQNKSKLLKKDTPFKFNDECHNAFKLLKEKLTCAHVIIIPNWNLPFELMCDASDFAVRAVLGKKYGKNFHPIYFARKMLNAAQQKYTVTEKELMAVVFAFDKFQSYLVLSKMIVHTDHSALRHLFKKQDAKPRLIRWILLLQEFDIEIKDKKDTENVTADHLSQIENDETSDDSEVDDNFHGETLIEISIRDIPWFADFANYLSCYLLPEETILSIQNAQSSHKRPRKLDDALWAFHTAYKTPTGTTPHKLIYGKNCHLPFKIEHCAYWALKNCNPDLITAGEKKMFQLHELDELRHQAYENSRLYKTAQTQISLARTILGKTPISIR
nr:DNA-directed DNA polymerase [Tanacetum cinerariifolium]